MKRCPSVYIINRGVISAVSPKSYRNSPRVSEAQERQVRKSLFKALMGAGADAVAEVADKLMHLLRRARP